MQLSKVYAMVGVVAAILVVVHAIDSGLTPIALSDANKCSNLGDIDAQVVDDWPVRWSYELERDAATSEQRRPVVMIPPS